MNSFDMTFLFFMYTGVSHEVYFSDVSQSSYYIFLERFNNKTTITQHFKVLSK